jgi:cytochrome P450
MRRAMRPLRALVGGAIASRRAQPRPGDDILTALLSTGLDDATLIDEVTTMTFLGAHQVSLALGWTLQSLAQHPAAQARVALEAAQTRQPAPLAYTAMVVQESLRLHPPFFLLVRDAVVDGELGGYRLRRGTTVAVSPWVLQRSPRYFAAPDEFRPERWSQPARRRCPVGESDAERARSSFDAASATTGATRSLGACFPFGAGPRACIANVLVRHQLTAVVAALVRRWSLALAGSPRPPRPDVTLAMAPPLDITLTARPQERSLEAIARGG